MKKLTGKQIKWEHETCGAFEVMSFYGKANGMLNPMDIYSLDDKKEYNVEIKGHTAGSGVEYTTYIISI